METVVDVKKEAIRSYLNDHKAGSIAGVELAKDLAEQNPGDEFYVSLRRDIEADQGTLERLMDKFGATGNPVKEAGAFVGEKIGTALGAGDDSLGLLRKLEALTIGIKGKLCLWESLNEIADASSLIQGFNIDGLAAGAASQLEGLEERRRKAARKALLA